MEKEVLREVVETLSHVVKLDLQVTASLSETLIPTATAIFLKAHAGMSIILIVVVFIIIIIGLAPPPLFFGIVC